MKSIIKKSILCALLGAPVGAHAAFTPFPDGEFTSGQGTWAEVGPITDFTYPVSGGNPPVSGGGYGVMDASNGQWGIWVSSNDNGSFLPLASLGLTAGKTYNFKMDMKLEVGSVGSAIGGIKLEWEGGGDTGDLRIATPAPTTSWQTYTYAVTIPAGKTGVKVVPLWGPGSIVGFDNLGVDNTEVIPPPVVPVVPNGDFEIANGASWSFFQGGGQTVSYPANGGNQNGNAVINSVGLGAFAVIVWNNNTPKSLASLGLTAGNTYTFQQDMKILAPAVGTPGRSIGGMKVDFIPGSTGDIYPSQLIGDGTNWETYSFQITIPLGVTQINLVALWGPNSNVAYDNFKILLPTPPAPPQPAITIGKMVSWTPTVVDNFYQPQESPDGVLFTDLGPAFTGTTVSSAFDSTPVPFYRVQESAPVVVQAVVNGGFEDLFFDDPEGWALVQSQPPTLNTTDTHTGANSIQIKVQNAATLASSNGSEIQQNIGNAGGSITAGKSYNFSFWAKQVSVGPSYVQQYRVQWLDGVGVEVGGAVGFQNFSGAIGIWEQKTQNNLIAPTGATSALIQILGVTGAVDGGFGEVIIDDVSLATTSAGAASTIASSSASAAEVSWQSITGQSYQVRSSTDLAGWSPFGGVISGNNSIKKVYDTPLMTKKFYQLGTLP